VLILNTGPLIIRRQIALGICLAACCVTAFLVAAFGDAYDNAKHQFLFNLLLDTCLVLAFVAAFVVVRHYRPVESREMPN
jgi:hypothetical protein